MSTADKAECTDGRRHRLVWRGRIRLWSAWILGILATTLATASCSHNSGNERDGRDRRNVLLIVVDTLRADKLGCYGSELGATPHIDRLAAEAVTFRRCYAHAPWTLPSFASMLTSLYPPQHGAGGHLPQFRGLPDSVRTAAECFRDGGYATASVINVEFLTEPFGMTQGFDHVDHQAYPNNIEVRSATETTNAAVTWLRRPRQGPFFLMVHYFDPHLVYSPPAAYRRRFAGPRDRKSADWVFGTREQIIKYRRGSVQFDDATIQRAEKLYNGEVAYTDSEVGRLLDTLDELELAESTIVVFTADHGEEFLDHGGFEHGHTLYEELVHVPLIIRDGGSAPSRAIDTVVGHVDLVPTLCELTGVPGDPSFVGHSLGGLMAGENGDDHPIIFEGNFWGSPLRGWLQGGAKLVLARAEPPKLFDLVRDPAEKFNLYDSNPDRVRRVAEDFKLAYKQMMMRVQQNATRVELSPLELERLRSLGYTD